MVGETVDGHKRKRVDGKTRQRDPVRSAHVHTDWRYGRRSVVSAVLVRFRSATRPWDLPLLTGLYRSAEDDCRRHRTPPRLRCRLQRVPLG